MASGPEHYSIAEHAIEASTYAYQRWGESGNAGDLKAAKWEQAQGQIHATLALAAATAVSHVPLAELKAWTEVIR